MIYCMKGWVRLVYEDQGEPFLLEPGDCVLQPPEIRHRVLESPPGLDAGYGFGKGWPAIRPGAVPPADCPGPNWDDRQG